MTDYIIEWSGIGARIVELIGSVPACLIPKRLREERLREEIVRCRDCEHGIKADLSGNWYECMKPDGNGDYARWDVEPDGFCAWGIKRKDDGE